MKRPWEDQTCGIENPVQEVTTSGRVKMRTVPREQNLADHLTKGKSQRSRRAHASESGQQKGTNTGGRSAKEDKATTAPTSHEAGRVRAVRGLNNPQADEGADGWNMTSSNCVLCEGSGRPTSSWKREARSSTKSDAHTRRAKLHLQHSARGAPRSKQVSRITAAEWNNRSRAVAVEGGSTHDRGKRGRCDQVPCRTHSA